MHVYTEVNVNCVGVRTLLSATVAVLIDLRTISNANTRILHNLYTVEKFPFSLILNSFDIPSPAPIGYQLFIWFEDDASCTMELSLQPYLLTLDKIQSIYQC